MTNSGLVNLVPLLTLERCGLTQLGRKDAHSPAMSGKKATEGSQRDRTGRETPTAFNTEAPRIPSTLGKVLKTPNCQEGDVMSHLSGNDKEQAGSHRPHILVSLHTHENAASTERPTKVIQHAMVF